MVQSVKVEILPPFTQQECTQLNFLFIEESEIIWISNDLETHVLFWNRSTRSIVWKPIQELPVTGEEDGETEEVIANIQLQPSAHKKGTFHILVDKQFALLHDGSAVLWVNGEGEGKPPCSILSLEFYISPLLGQGKEHQQLSIMDWLQSIRQSLSSGYNHDHHYLQEQQQNSNSETRNVQPQEQDGNDMVNTTWYVVTIVLLLIFAVLFLYLLSGICKQISNRKTEKPVAEQEEPLLPPLVGVEYES